MDRVMNARSLSRDIGVSYAAAHAAVERLVGRGLLLRHRNGVRQEPFTIGIRRQRAQSGELNETRDRSYSHLNH
jgi:hypothetical protein